MRDIDKLMHKWGGECPSTQRRKSDHDHSKRPTEIISKAVVIKSVSKPKSMTKHSKKD